MARTIPSLKKFQELTDYYRYPRTHARDLRESFEQLNFSHASVYERLKDANRILVGHGIEAARVPDEYINSYYHDIVMEYVNMGDAYAPTVIYDTERGKFSIESWGEWMEKQERSGRYKFE